MAKRRQRSSTRSSLVFAVDRDGLKRRRREELTPSAVMFLLLTIVTICFPTSTLSSRVLLRSVAVAPPPAYEYEYKYEYTTNSGYAYPTASASARASAPESLPSRGADESQSGGGVMSKMDSREDADADASHSSSLSLSADASVSYSNSVVSTEGQVKRERAESHPHRQHKPSDTESDTESDADKVSESDAATPSAQRLERPVIYTFYSRLLESDGAAVATGEEDDESESALIDFWRQSWREAGWKPVVLGVDTAKQHAAFATVTEAPNLSLSTRLYLYRWLAMAMQPAGGWYAEYDVFPLVAATEMLTLQTPTTSATATDAEAEAEGKLEAESQHIHSLPNNGEMTLHEALSLSLASGSSESWAAVASWLVRDATTTTTSGRKLDERPSSWSEMSALLRLWKQPPKSAAASAPTAALRGTVYPQPLPRVHTDRTVLSGDKGLELVGLDETPDCQSGSLRNKWAIHFGRLALQRAVTIRKCQGEGCRMVGLHHRPALVQDVEGRLPRQRITVARRWLPIWKQKCRPHAFDTNDQTPSLVVEEL